MGELKPYHNSGNCNCGAQHGTIDGSYTCTKECLSWDALYAFTEDLNEAGWTARNDAQHTRIVSVFQKWNTRAKTPEQIDYAYPTIEDYEESTEVKVNDAFKIGWAMARVTNNQLGINKVCAERSEGR